MNSFYRNFHANFFIRGHACRTSNAVRIGYVVKPIDYDAVGRSLLVVFFFS